jgi:hypothetical protein
MGPEVQEEAWTATLSLQYLAKGVHCLQLTFILTPVLTVCLLRYDPGFLLSLRNSALLARESSERTIKRQRLPVRCQYSASNASYQPDSRVGSLKVE